MKLIFASLFTALALMAYPPSQAHADTEITLDFFYEALEPQGDWVYVDDYGYCFRPFVSYDNAEWQPYTDGYWAESDAGWTWVSEEEFGWATYHYGRWAMVGGYWSWVPGYDWAPAWVSWRTSSEHIGWAPLPPEARWDQDVGFHGWVDTYFDIGPSYYSFVPVRYFGAERYHDYYMDRGRNYDLCRETTNITNISFRSSNVSYTNIYVGGPNYDEVNRLSERKLRRLKLHADDRNDWNRDDFRRGGMRNRVDNDTFNIIAPRVNRSERDQAPRQVKARFDKSDVDRGWKNVDESRATELRQKFTADTKTRRDRDGAKGRDEADIRKAVVAAPVTASAVKAPSADVPKGVDRKAGGRDGSDRAGRGENAATAGRDREGREGRMPNAKGPDEAAPGAPRAPGTARSGEPDPAAAAAAAAAARRDKEQGREGRMPNARADDPPGPGTSRPNEPSGPASRRDRDGKPGQKEEVKPAIPRAEVIPEPGSKRPEGAAGAARREGESSREGRMPGSAGRPDETPGPGAKRPDEPAGSSRRERDQPGEARKPAVPRAEVMPESSKGQGRGDRETPGASPRGPGAPDAERAKRPERPAESSPPSQKREDRPSPPQKREQARPQPQPQPDKPAAAPQQRAPKPESRPAPRPEGGSQHQKKEDAPGKKNRDSASAAQRQQQGAQAQAAQAQAAQAQARRQQAAQSQARAQQEAQASKSRQAAAKPQPQRQRQQQPQPNAQAQAQRQQAAQAQAQRQQSAQANAQRQQASQAQAQRPQAQASQANAQRQQAQAQAQRSQKQQPQRNVASPQRPQPQAAAPQRQAGKGKANADEEKKKKGR